jgi:hypothetical protein
MVARTLPQAARIPAARGIDINPATGLTAAYLDQFSQAIMLLEMLAATPDCADKFYNWRPLSYREHLDAAPAADRAGALAAYEAADPVLRERLDRLAQSMIDVAAAARDVMQTSPTSPAIGMLASRAARWLGGLACRAGAVIDGAEGAREH